MDSESIRMLRDRQEALWCQLEELRSGIKLLEVELDQVERGIRAMEGPPLSLPTGQISSRNAMAHHKRMAKPEGAILTIKQMVVKALGEHLTNGANANELLDFFTREWGRNEIMRTSLSPQLTRLKIDGKIQRRGKVWFIAEPPNVVGTACGELDRNELGEAEASPTAGEGATSPDFEPRSSEQPIRDGSVPGD